MPRAEARGAGLDKHGVIVFTERMSIMREWRGVIRRADCDTYVAYIQSTGLNDYRSTPGNLGALIAWRDLDQERTEVVTLSWWESWDAIRAFAGDPPDRARYYPMDDRYLLSRPPNVQHYESSGSGTVG